MTFLQASLLLLHPEVNLPSERKMELEDAVVALLNGRESMGLQPMQAPLLMQVDQHQPLLRCVCSWQKTTQIVEESGVLQLHVTSLCSMQPLAVSSLFVDMNPPNLSFTVTHHAGVHGVRAVEFKHGAGSAQADLSVSPRGSGSVFQFSVRVDAVGLVHPKSFSFTIGSGASSLQVAAPRVLQPVFGSNSPAAHLRCARPLHSLQQVAPRAPPH